MSARTIGTAIGALATAALVYAAFDTYQDRQGATTLAAGELFVPGFGAQLNATGRVRAITPNGPATIERDGEGWVVRERGGYRANPEQVNKLLIGLAHLRRVEAKTSKPERYAKLGLETPGEDNSNANRYTIEDAGGKVALDILVGDRKPARGNPTATDFYVRLADDPQAWLVEGTLPISSDVVDWLDDALMELDVRRVKRVTVRHGDGALLDVARTPGKDDGFTLVNVPDGREVDNPLLIRNVATGIMKFPLDDVAAADSPAPAEPDVVFTVDTYDGLRAAMTGQRDGDDFTQLWLRASYLADGAEHEAPADERPGTGDDEIVRLDADAVQAEVERRNAAWGGWRFEVGNWRLATADKRVEDFLKKPADGEAAGKAPAADSS